MGQTSSKNSIRIGAGAGFAGDRIDPAIELVTKGALDALVFEVLAERTIALAQRRRRTGSGPGFDDRLQARMRAVLPEALRQQTRIITNGGAADPHAAGLAVREVAQELALSGCRVAVV